MQNKLKMALLVAILSLIVASSGVGFAAPGPDGAQSRKPGQADPASKPGRKISREKAILVALKAHRHAKLVSIKLTGDLYLVVVKTSAGSFELQIGANTGRVIKDQPRKPQPGAPGDRKQAVKPAEAKPVAPKVQSAAGQPGKGAAGKPVEVKPNVQGQPAAGQAGKDTAGKPDRPIKTPDPAPAPGR